MELYVFGPISWNDFDHIKFQAYILNGELLLYCDKGNEQF